MTKAELHELVDALPDESVDPAGVLLRRAQDPVLAKLDAAPCDEEPFDDEDRAAAEEALREPGVPWHDVSSELTSGAGAALADRDPPRRDQKSPPPVANGS